MYEEIKQPHRSGLKMHSQCIKRLRLYLE